MASYQPLDEPELPWGLEDEPSEKATSADDLEVNQRRWLIVGICLHSIISPVLPEIIQPVLEHQYDKLVKSNNIGKQIHGNHLKKYSATSSYELNYKSINNNNKEKRGPKYYDYQVKNSVDYSKLYLLPHMAMYTGIDETCDSSALFGILLNSDGFAQDVKQNAKQARDSIRNPWAHCNFNNWDEAKYEESFNIMSDLIKSLTLENNNDMVTRKNLSKWKTKGHTFCIEATRDLQFVEIVKQHSRNLQVHMNNIAQQTNESLNEVKSEIDKVQSNLNTVIKRLENFERKLQCHEIRIECLEDIIKTSKHSTDANLQHMVYFNVPDRKETFTGRSLVLNQLEDMLLKNKQEGQSKVALCGLGGIGKTTIATEYAWRNRSSYSGGVFWLQGETNEGFENNINRLASESGMLLLDFQKTYWETLAWLSGLSKQSLIILDNVDDKDPGLRYEFILNRRLSNLCHHMVITTRLSTSEVTEHFRCTNNIEIKKLPPDESFEFVKKRTQLEDDTQDKDIKCLCKTLDGLPLALEQASLMLKNLKCTVNEYINEYEKKKTDLLKYESVPNIAHVQDVHRLCVSTTWFINLQKIELKSEQIGPNIWRTVALLIDILSCCAGENIPVELLNEGEPLIEDLNFNKMTVKLIVQLLTKYSLVTQNGDSLTMHNLVQTVIRKRFENDVKRGNEVIQCVIRMMVKALQNARERNKSRIILCLENQCNALRRSLQLSGNKAFILLRDLCMETRQLASDYQLVRLWYWEANWEENWEANWEENWKALGDPLVERLGERYRKFLEIEQEKRLGVRLWERLEEMLKIRLKKRLRERLRERLQELLGVDFSTDLVEQKEKRGLQLGVDVSTDRIQRMAKRLYEHLEKKLVEPAEHPKERVRELFVETLVETVRELDIRDLQLEKKEEKRLRELFSELGLQLGVDVSTDVRELLVEKVGEHVRELDLQLVETRLQLGETRLYEHLEKKRFHEHLVEPASEHLEERLEEQRFQEHLVEPLEKKLEERLEEQLEKWLKEWLKERSTRLEKIKTLEQTLKTMVLQGETTDTVTTSKETVKKL